MNDARRKREFMKYVFEIIKAAKITKTSIFSQITMIYIDLKFEFQRDMIKFIEIIIMNDCIQKLKNNKKL